MEKAHKQLKVKTHPFILMLISSVLLFFLLFNFIQSFKITGGFVLGSRAVKSQYQSSIPGVQINYRKENRDGRNLEAEYPFFNIPNVDSKISEFVNNSLERGSINQESSNYLLSYSFGFVNQNLLSFVLRTPTDSKGFTFNRQDGSILNIVDLIEADEDKVSNYVRFLGLDLYNQLTYTDQKFFIDNELNLVFLKDPGQEIISALELKEILNLEFLKIFVPDLEPRFVEYTNQKNKLKEQTNIYQTEALLENQTDIDCTLANTKCIALVVDGGPNEQYLNLLKTFDTLGVKATFYPTGKDILDKTDVFLQLLGSGHEIGSGTWSYPKLSELDKAAVEMEFNKTREIIWNTVGIVPNSFLPSFGEILPEQESAIPIEIIKGPKDTRDWELDDPQRIAQIATSNITPGQLILLHTLKPSTSEALPLIVEELEEDGYQFVTVSKLAN
jgi:peptidoglycan/xylan/chitin deacetylase (PgdA/CDA1 family)